MCVCHKQADANARTKDAYGRKVLLCGGKMTETRLNGALFKRCNPQNCFL